MKRLVCSTELTKEGATLFKSYLREHDIYFEASEVEHLIHFLCEMSEEEMEEANKWIEEHV